eukprot:12153367-Prorocentrum_lima.AAC.1
MRCQGCRQRLGMALCLRVLKATWGAPHGAVLKACERRIALGRSFEQFCASCTSVAQVAPPFAS